MSSFIVLLEEVYKNVFLATQFLTLTGKRNKWRIHPTPVHFGAKNQMYLNKFQKIGFFDTFLIITQQEREQLKLEGKKKPRNKTWDKGGQVVRGKLILDENFRIIRRRMWRKML